ncbi:hypothetical protein [Streptomyces scabiei]|uniref:hypothetical protein n=1 Tax=Streptomyces scabiei TaxID=1930 RepID=UPI0007C73781
MFASIWFPEDGLCGLRMEAESDRPRSHVVQDLLLARRVVGAVLGGGDLVGRQQPLSEQIGQGQRSPATAGAGMDAGFCATAGTTPVPESSRAVVILLAYSVTRRGRVRW